jgi:type IV secretory pathway VirB10-like protein
MKEQTAESLVNAERAEHAGIVTVRRSVVMTAGAVVMVFGIAAFWLVRMSPSAKMIVGGAPAQAADITTINERIVKADDALRLPTPTLRQKPLPDAALVADYSAPTSFSAPETLSQPAARENLPLRERHRALDNQLSAQQEAVTSALNADLSVNLGNVSPAVTANAVSPVMSSVDTNVISVREYVLQRGTIIPASLYTPIDSTVPGTVTAQVRQDVYDSTHRYLLVPRGSRLVGAYASGLANGQARLFVGFDSIKLPNGHTVDLGNMPGTDLQGIAGLGGKADFHTSRFLGNAVLLSILGAGSQLVQPRGAGTSLIINGAGQTANQQVSVDAAQIASQYQNQPPTMHTLAGVVLDVMVQHDVSLEPYAYSMP